ncbi:MULTISPECIES: trans-acting enoyl reductase family protein [unclassified Dietzia]|uniref:saccharopine dehydrogenase family protein n=1 Tax=unclassified Dietzia TaxID=2617939 RepID=UPI000D1FFB05|nr:MULTISPECIES: saccharopine dehydrogenase NADP-binding domain-containing protein [unclassified Dietzia]AVZ38708.1 saccharopine dehydrogenase [Dietzia sp. JS16-p6b]QGW23804.1 saccharopine dehydrogenase [Dietzia sp. DQ12-45-1b]
MSESTTQPESASDRSHRPFDIVVYGATGYTGGLVADYLMRNLPEGGAWAVAGRSRVKLDALVARLSAEMPDVPAPGIVVADTGDPESLADMAGSARVVLTTVGPYLEYGEPLVAACAEAGTDYVDLTGEPEFADRMYLEYHDTAVASGARIIHACGFDSIPHDLGVYYTMKQVPEGVPVAVYGAVHADAQFSGGTYHSAIGQFARLRQAARTAKARRAKEGRVEGRRIKSVTGKPHHDSVLGRWLVPLPTIDPQIVLRSAAALESYGPDFSYAHYASVKSPLTATAGMVGVGALAVGAQIGPIRSQLLKRIDRGAGPSESRRARSSFDVTFVALAGGRRVVTRVCGGDPGYTETSMMIAESALCLAFDELSALAGQLTTAQAMGDALLARVERGGLTFEVLST